MLKKLKETISYVCSVAPVQSWYSLRPWRALQAVDAVDAGEAGHAHLAAVALGTPENTLPTCLIF